jgi:hypothetical protein
MREVTIENLFDEADPAMRQTPQDARHNEQQYVSRYPGRANGMLSVKQHVDADLQMRGVARPKGVTGWVVLSPLVTIVFT